MSGFVYFIEGVTGPAPEKLMPVGLDYAVEPKTATWRGCGAVGTAKRGGQLVGVDSALIMGKPQQLTWQQSINKKYWIGWDPAAIPNAVDIARRPQIAGHQVRMGDGGKWLIPVARAFGQATVLPCTLILGAGGELVTEPIARYAEFGKRAEELWHDAQIELGWATGDLKLNMTARMRLLIDAMAFNYRVGIDEVNILKLLASDKISEALGAIVDMPAIVQRAKESLAADSKKKEATDI